MEANPQKVLNVMAARIAQRETEIAVQAAIIQDLTEEVARLSSATEN